MTKHGTKKADQQLLEVAIQAAREAFTDTDSFPFLSTHERRAFEYWFGRGYADAWQGAPAKEDWTGALEATPDAGFNRDSYNAGYNEARRPAGTPVDEAWTPLRRIRAQSLDALIADANHPERPN